MRCSRFNLLQALLVAFSPSIVLGGTAKPVATAAAQIHSNTNENIAETKPTNRIRIPIVLKSWQEVSAVDSSGRETTSRIVGQPVSQILRARIERSNEFYVGNFRIKTVPMRWLRNSQQYQIRLEVFQTAGSSSQIEASLGSVILTGNAKKQTDGLYLLTGTARRLFRSKAGEPILDFTAGQQPVDAQSTDVSRL
jgi:hypothetical protein